MKKRSLRIKPCVFSYMNKTPLLNCLFILLAFFLISNHSNAQSGTTQNRTVSGHVIDSASNLPLEGVTVSVEGKGTKTLTDKDGNFTIALSGGNTLVFSSVGFADIRMPVAANQQSLQVVMTSASSSLNQVVVVGYTTQRKETVTGSVASIKGSEMARTRNENTLNMLTGKLPGVRVVQKSARPGAYDAVIDIRGMGDPLFVIDGIVRDKDYFARMSPEEIESVSVLKDGSAAVYGLRAGNGVVLVTTKTGSTQNGRVDITFTSSISLAQYLYVPQGMNAQDYYTIRNEQNWQDFGGNYLVRRNAMYSDSLINLYKNGTKQSYNWMNQVFRKNTPQYDNNLSVNGGSDKLRYYFNLGYTKQEGAYKSGDLESERWALRTNVDAQITKRLKARVQLGAILTNTKQPNGSGWPTYKNTWLMRPDAPFYANDNPAYPNGDGNLLYDGHNMIVETSADYVGLNTTNDKRYNGTLRLEYEIPGIKGLSAKALYDQSMTLPDYNNYKSSFTLYRYNQDNDTYTPNLKNAPSSIEKGTSLNYANTLQAGLYYTNSFAGKHNVSSFLIYEQAYSKWDGFSAYRQLLINSQYLFAGEANQQQAIGQFPGDRANRSFIGSVTYDFDKKYLLDFKFRNDESSRFPAGSRSGFFPAISAGWRLGEEGFIKNHFNFISELKVFGSYGELGDDNSADNYPPTPGYSLTNNVGWFFGGVLNGGLAALPIPNPNLTWYRIKSYNAGINFGLLKNTITGTVEIYRRDRSGLLATSGDVIPGTVGATLPQENLNNDRNFGYEISLAYRKRLRDLSYYVSGQLSATKYMRTDWLETPASNSYDKWRNRTANRYQNIWWGNESAGMFTTYDQIRNFTTVPVGQGTLPGDWYLNDWNGDGVVNANDDHPIGTTGLPVFNYGISLGGSWKNFDVALDWQGAYGVYVQYAEVLTEALPFGGQNTLTWFSDRWHPEDPNADYFNPNTKWIPGYYPVTGHDGRRTGTNGVMNASYIRLKTAELGYNFNPNLLSRAGFREFRLFLSGYNLLTFTPLKNVDPERPGAAGGASTNYIDFYNDPITRTYTIGARVKF